MDILERLDVITLGEQIVERVYHRRPRGLLVERSTVTREPIEKRAEKLDASSADQIPEPYRADAR